MSGYAHYTSPSEAVINPEPGWYDVLNNVLDESIVGWAIWYADGTRFCSLEGSADLLPDSNVQVLVVWHLRSDGSGKMDRGIYTEEVYPIPNSDIILKGDWTGQTNHHDLVVSASKESWPPSWYPSEIA